MSKDPETVQELLTRWNPPPEDHAMERLVGAPPEHGDTRATTHTPMDEVNSSFTSSSVDAQRQQYQDDGDDDEPVKALEDMSKDELKGEAEARGLAKSGSKDDLIERIREHDAAADEDDDPDEDDDADEE